MGSVVISVEVGTGWATNPDDVTDERYRETLDAWRRASYLFDRHELPATWLVAGHLFGPVGREGTLPGREESDPTDDTATRRAAGGERAGSPERTDESRASSDDRNADGGPASDRQGAGRDAGDEPDASPCVHPGQADQPRSARDSATDRAWLARSARDLIAGLTRSRVAHEVGCVPFAELDVGDASQEEAVETVRATIDAAAELGVEAEALRTFAFPENAGHDDVLAAYGFECYREPSADGRLSTLGTLVGLLARRLPGTGPRLVEPRTDDHGMVAIPTSASLFPLAGRARAVARAGRGDPVADLAKRGVDRADGSDGVFHLALRPGDFRTEADFERLEAVLAHVAARRDRPGLAVETMGEVARRLGEYAAAPTTPVR